MINDDRSATNTARLKNVEWVEEQICAWTSKLTRAEIMAKLDGSLPAGPVQNMSDIFKDEHVAARGMLDKCNPGGDNPDISLAASPIKFSRSKTTLYQSPPTLGEHNKEVLSEFGIDLPDDF